MLRLAFVSGVYDGCLKQQRSFSENKSLSTSELGAYCFCYGRALADAMDGAEAEGVRQGRLPDNFQKKAEVASNFCITRMNPSAQRSKREQEIVELRNRCTREYHPEDTDLGAAIVRETYCVCYSTAVAKSGGKPKSPSVVVDYCSRRISQRRVMPSLEDDSLP